MFRTYQVSWTALTRQGPKRRYSATFIPIAGGHRLRAPSRASRTTWTRLIWCGGGPGPCARGQPGVASRSHRRPGLDPGGHARRHGVLAHVGRHLPCRRRRAYQGQRIRQCHLHRLCARLPEESRISSETKAKPFSKAVRPPTLPSCGFRSRLQRSCDRGRSDGFLGRAQMGFLTD